MPYSGLSQGKTFNVQINDDGTLPEALAKVDKYLKDNPDESIFPIFEGYISNYLQLIWNPKTNQIYNDIGIMAYGPNREFMPLHENPDFSLIPESEINIQLDPGC
ncbi:MAG: hypothetical protein GF311_18510 [Candidatus Lokiarchaeota archaeon]|nr:hypothetical protein [Candidatus Lokiarchaeota archaeon]